MADNDKHKSAAVDAKISSLLPSNKPKTVTYKGYGKGSGGYGKGYNYGGAGFDDYDAGWDRPYSHGWGPTPGASTHVPGRRADSVGDYYLRKLEYQIGAEIDTKHVVATKMVMRASVRAVEQLFGSAYKYELNEDTNVVEVPAEVARKQLHQLSALVEAGLEAMNVEASEEGKAMLAIALATLVQEQVVERLSGRAMGYPQGGA